MKEAMVEFGTAYFHMLHNLPDVAVFCKHHVPLLDEHWNPACEVNDKTAGYADFMTSKVPEKSTNGEISYRTSNPNTLIFPTPRPR